jgi:phosphotransferase system enzyme I (PtsI)
MEIKRGIPVSAGVAIGPALVVDTEGFRIPQRHVEKKQRKEEVGRLHEALEAAGKEARANQELIAEKLGKQYGAIFAAHAALMKDPDLIKEVEFLIRDQNNAAEYAVSRVMRRHVKALENLDQGHFSERASDLIDIEKAILTHLLGERREPVGHLTQPVIVLAHDMTPSQTASLDPEKVHSQSRRRDA